MTSYPPEGVNSAITRRTDSGWVKSVMQIAWPLVVILFVTDILLDYRAESEVTAHREAIAADGGGVLFLAHALDCIYVSQNVAVLAKTLGDRQVPLRGLVIRESDSRAAVRDAIEVGNTRFPHFEIRARSIAPLFRVTGFDTTPIALVVDSTGHIVGLEHVGSDPEVVGRLARLVEGNTG